MHTPSKRPLRFVFLVLAFLGLVLLLLHLAIFHGFSVTLSPSEAASVGIIGGADGPTAIFVSGVPGFLGWFLPIGLIVAGLAGFFLLGRKKK